MAKVVPPVHSKRWRDTRWKSNQQYQLLKLKETTRPREKRQARETIQASNSKGICGLRERSDIFFW